MKPPKLAEIQVTALSPSEVTLPCHSRMLATCEVELTKKQRNAVDVDEDESVKAGIE